MQKLALFDLDSTLVDRATATHAWVAELAEQFGLDADQCQWVKNFDGGMRTWHAYAEAICERLGLVEHVDVVRTRFRYGVGQAAAYPEVLGGLTRLKETGWKVAVVTNGMGPIQRDKLLFSGLRDLLDGWAISGQEKIAKPDIRLFEIAAARAGAKLDGAWMIGNDPIKDIAGGRAAGLKTIWMNRRSLSWPEGQPEADHAVVDVAEAVEILLRS
ncbi:HAD family hydrolase [Nonomuraea endophytica]|uniref:HAD family hydrolase n=1 Tax=Nonomuraea endophytica TaxID=714136 RepID=UPI0037C74BAB